MNFKNNIIAVIVLALASLSGQAQTFHEDIAPIIYDNCTSCHRVGEIGPMQFTTYDEVSSQGSFIEYVINSGIMPPWTPDGSKFGKSEGGNVWIDKNMRNIILINLKNSQAVGKILVAPLTVSFFLLPLRLLVGRLSL